MSLVVYIFYLFCGYVTVVNLWNLIRDSACDPFVSRRLPAFRTLCVDPKALLCVFVCLWLCVCDFCTRINICLRSKIIFKLFAQRRLRPLRSNEYLRGFPGHFLHTRCCAHNCRNHLLRYLSIEALLPWPALFLSHSSHSPCNLLTLRSLFACISQAGI